MRARLFLSLLACSFSVLGQEFIVSPEMPISRLSYGHSYRSAWTPAVAVGRNQALVVWNGGANLARVASDGTVIDVPMISRTKQARQWMSADVVWTGQHYVVPSITCSNCIVPPFGPWRPTLTMATVGIDGTVGPLTKIADVDGTELTAAASTAGVLVVVVSSKIEAFAFDTTGRLINRRLIASNSSWLTRVSVASNGTSYFVVRSMNGRVIGTRLTASGDLMDVSTRPAIDVPGDDASVAWNGNEYAIAYTIGGKELHVLHGLEANQKTSAIYGAGHELFLPAIKWTGGQYRIAWKEVSGEASLQCSGLTGDVGYDEPCAPVDAIAASIDGRGALVNREVLGRAVDRYGHFTSVDRLAIDGSLITWSESGDIVARTDRARESVIVSRSAAEQYWPVLAQNGDDFIALWREKSDRAVLRMSRYSVQRQRFGLLRTLSQSLDSPPAEAWDGTDTLIVWGEQTDASHSNLQLAIADEQGRIWKTSTLASVPAHGLYPSVACGNWDCVVTWIEYPHAFAKRIAADGSVLDANPVDLGIGVFGAPAQWNGHSYVIATEGQLVFMREGRVVNQVKVPRDRSAFGCGDGTCILAFRYDTTAMVDDAGKVTISKQPNNLNSIVWTGRAFVGLSMPDCGTTAAHFTRDGKLGSSQQISAASPDGCDVYPVLAEREDGKGLIAYVHSSAQWDLPAVVLVRTIRDLKD